MTIQNQNLENRLNQMETDVATSIDKDLATEQVIQDIVEDKPAPIVNDPSDPIEPSVFTQEEPILVAGIGSLVESAAKKILKETLEVPGT